MSQGNKPLRTPGKATAEGAESSAVVPVLDYEPLEGGQRIFTVGTLRYTAAGLVFLFFWLLLGDFALSIRDRSVGPVVQTLLKKYEATDTLMSIMLVVIPPAIGLFLSPIVSYKSDRFRSKWGRRIPFLLVPTPVAFLSMVGLAYSPSLGEAMFAKFGTQWGMSLNACVLTLFAVFWTLFEVAVITAGAVVGGLINDVVPRQFLGRFFGLFRAVSLGAGILFNRWLFGWAQTHFFEIFIGIGVIFAVGFTVMCLMVKEGEYPPPQENPDDVRGKGFFGAVRVYFRECFSSGYYALVFVTMLVAGLTFLPFNSFSIPYSQSLGMSGTDYGKWVANSYVISLILAYPLGWLVDKFHALRVGLAAMIMYAVATLYGTMFVKDPATFAVALVAHTVLSGTYFTATASLGQALFPRLKFGQFASAAGLVASVGTITTGLILGPVLDRTGHNYRLTLVAGMVLCLTTIVLLTLVYRNFMRLGGPKGYVAPDPGELRTSKDPFRA